MSTEPRSLRAQITVLGLFFALRTVFQAWALVLGPVPGLHDSSPLWPNLIAYGFAAPWTAYLIWKRNPRARMAAYVFLTFDILRAARWDTWVPVVVDLAALAYLQTPTMRRVYPSMWSRGRDMLTRAVGR